MNLQKPLRRGTDCLSIRSEVSAHRERAGGRIGHREPSRPVHVVVGGQRVGTVESDAAAVLAGEVVALHVGGESEITFYRYVAQVHARRIVKSRRAVESDCACRIRFNPC